MATLLIAEDEDGIRRLVSDFLKREGHRILEAKDGQEALDLAQVHAIDLFLLDIMMPKVDGLGVLRALRAQTAYQKTPILLLTARTGERDEVQGLSLGADDYMAKPFSPAVLVARVQNLLARFGKDTREPTQIGMLTLDEVRREVRVAGTVCDLTPKEYELLLYLKNNRSIALSRESILNAVWGYDYLGDVRTVDSHIKKLRAKLGQAGGMIATVRGMGYRLEGA